jgi:hypothetical protein
VERARSEGNVVVGFAATHRIEAAATAGGAAATRRGPTAVGAATATAVVVVVLAPAAAAATAAAAEQLDTVGDDLRRVPLLPVLVVPRPRLDAAFDVDLLALLQVILQRLGLLAQQDDAMPLGLLDPVAGLAVLADR